MVLGILCLAVIVDPVERLELTPSEYASLYGVCLALYGIDIIFTAIVSHVMCMYMLLK